MASGGFCLIAGTTASGKSALALELAQRTRGVIVNADSVQLYKSLPLLTAQPSAEDTALAPHRLYGILEDREQASVARWLELASGAINEAQPRPAIVVGGTAFYIEALIHGLPTVPATPDELRERSREHLDRVGLDALRQELADRDPNLAAAGLPLDPQRLLRAWEVLEATGRSIVLWQAEPRRRPALPAYRGGVALLPPRDLLWRRIEARVRQMVEAGAIEEVRDWLKQPSAAGSPLLKADGVSAFAAHLRGEIDLKAAIEATAIKVRRYAKRQRTWLANRSLPVTRLEVTGNDAVALIQA